MAWHLSYDRFQDVFVVSAAGAWNGTEADAAIVRMAGDPNFRPGARVLFDCRGIDAAAAVPAAFAGGVHVRVFAASARRAIVIPAGFPSSVATRWSRRTKQGEIRLFADPTTALDWLHDGAPPGKRLI